MDEFESNKIYKPVNIPDRQQVQGEGNAKSLSKEKTAEEPITLTEGMYYEIEYDSCPIPGVGKFVLKPQKIQEPEKDEKRDLFRQMREIAGAYRSSYDNSRFFNPRVKQYNAMVFYKQGIFMKDFSDNYSEHKPFSQYFPCYQMMGYEQLRTYFTWRSEVRKGNVTDITLSYAFLYVYELLNHIGVTDPLDGLNKLMSFWKAFSTYNTSLDKYVLRWLKDYHIYYELSHTFKEFIDSNDLTWNYPKLVDTDDNYDLLFSLSKYDIKKSTFFAGDNVSLIKDCFQSVIDKLREVFINFGIKFDESIFQPTKKMLEWKPFKDALFHPWKKQTDKRIVLSENEIYICNKNKWTFSTVITSDEGRQLIGYIVKQIEVELRKLTKFKYKLSATMDGLNHEVINKLKEANVSLDSIIRDTVAEVYKEATKTIVTVDLDSLSRIRQEALTIQEKLVIPEQLDLFGVTEKPTVHEMMDKLTVQETLSIQNMVYSPIKQPVESITNIITDKQPVESLSNITTSIQPTESYSAIESTDTYKTSVSDIWMSLKEELSEIELNALSVVLNNHIELKKYADQCGIMLEVLVEGINDKAMDLIGDSLIDEEFALYDDYKENVKELIG